MWDIGRRHGKVVRGSAARGPIASSEAHGATVAASVLPSLQRVGRSCSVGAFLGCNKKGTGVALRIFWRGGRAQYINPALPAPLPAHTATTTYDTPYPLTKCTYAYQ